MTKMETCQTGSAGVVSEYSSEYLENGQKSKEISSVLGKDGKKRSSTATYTYDLLGRLRKETRTGSDDITYSYDSNNNRKEMKVGNKTTAYRYNKNDELLRTDTLNSNTEKDAVVIYKNDKNGNQLATVNRYEIPNDKKDGTYIDIDVTLGDNRLNENVVNRYNALNQLTKALTKNYKVSYTYDAEGLRTSKTVNGEKTVYTAALSKKSKRIVHKAGRWSPKLSNGKKMKVSDALDLASDFLGKGYTEPVHGSGRFVSADGRRVFRMGVNDILGKHGGGPHVNFELLAPNPAKHGKMKVIKNIHIYLEDS